MPAVSDNTVGPMDGYATPAKTRLYTINGGEEAIMTGGAVAYVYGFVRYKDMPGAPNDLGDRFCWEFDATRSQAFFGCPPSAMQ